jgi:2-dehydro-3-deoxyphosphogalactonate aldolase
MTDDNIEGWGECPAPWFREHAFEQLIKDTIKRYVIGEDPFNIERIWESLYQTRSPFVSHHFQHPDTVMSQVNGACEMACWDIIGKTLNQPIYRLIGGKRNEKLRAYTYLYDWRAGDPPDKAGPAAIKLVEKGFTLFKLDPLMPYNPQPRAVSLKELQYADSVFKSLRDSVGLECDIALGTHGNFTTASAIKVAKTLEKYNILWFEEPVPPENIDEMARVAQHTNIPIATGERLTTKWEFRLLLEKQAAQIIQIMVGQNGILESKKIAAIAEAHYAQIAPWMHCGPVNAAANIQLDVTSPNFLAQESIEAMEGLHADILEEPIKVEKGYIIPSNKPGLGIGRVKEELLEKYPYQSDVIFGK